MYVGDAQDAQDDAVRAPASGRNFFFCDGNVSAEACIFGNIPILLRGDYTQIAPVVGRGNRATTVRTSWISSEVWK